MVRVKVCCISSVEEAEAAVRLGANALGLVSEMPSGPGVIPESLIASIAASVPATVDTFLLTSQTNPDLIIEQHSRCRTTTLQLCDTLETGAYSELRTALPTTALVQVIHVTGLESLSESRRAAGSVDALLLDSGNPGLPVKELGGAGRTHNWEVSAEIVATTAVPVWLAGGLNASNVGAAIASVRPYGVDLCTGVRSNEQLELRKLKAFMKAVHNEGG